MRKIIGGDAATQQSERQPQHAVAVMVRVYSRYPSAASATEATERAIAVMTGTTARSERRTPSWLGKPSPVMWSGGGMTTPGLSSS